MGARTLVSRGSGRSVQTAPIEAAECAVSAVRNIWATFETLPQIGSIGRRWAHSSSSTES